MSQTTDDLTVQAPLTAVDLAGTEALGRDVVSAMQSLRELLEARATALADCRSALEEQASRLEQERAERARQGILAIW